MVTRRVTDGESVSQLSPCAIGAATVAVKTPHKVSRALPRTSDTLGGKTRGMTALRETPYAFEHTRAPKAAG